MDPADADHDVLTHLALHDTQFNVMGIIARDDATAEFSLGTGATAGSLVERYEYTPYGERTVYISAGDDDPLCTAPLVNSQRVTDATGTALSYGLCTIGHQGLMHDEPTGNIQNRARMRHARLGRFHQRDPLGYVDGVNLHQALNSNPLLFADHSGTNTTVPLHVEKLAMYVEPNIANGTAAEISVGKLAKDGKSLVKGSEVLRYVYRAEADQWISMLGRKHRGREIKGVNRKVMQKIAPALQRRMIKIAESLGGRWATGAVGTSSRLAAVAAGGASMPRGGGSVPRSVALRALDS